MTIYCNKGKKESQTDLQQTNQHWTIILWQLKLWYQQSHTEDRSFEILRNMSLNKTQICYHQDWQSWKKDPLRLGDCYTTQKKLLYSNRLLYDLAAFIQTSCMTATGCPGNFMQYNETVIIYWISQLMSKKAYKENSELD